MATLEEILSEPNITNPNGQDNVANTITPPNFNNLETDSVNQVDDALVSEQPHIQIPIKSLLSQNGDVGGIDMAAEPFGDASTHHLYPLPHTTENGVSAEYTQLDLAQVISPTDVGGEQGGPMFSALDDINTAQSHVQISAEISTIQHEPQPDQQTSGDAIGSGTPPDAEMQDITAVAPVPNLTVQFDPAESNEPSAQLSPVTPTVNVMESSGTLDAPGSPEQIENGLDLGTEPTEDSQPVQPEPEPPKRRRAKRKSRAGASVLTTQGWTLDDIVSSSPNFQAFDRLSVSKLSKEDLLEQVKHYDEQGIPLVIDGWHEQPGWNRERFDIAFFEKSLSSENVRARNVHTRDDESLPISELVSKLRAAPLFAESEETERLYGKDLPCPPEWQQAIQEIGFPPERLPYGAVDQFCNLDPDDRPETLMTYFGVGDTFTPCHKDLCASVGQNLMVYSSKLANEEEEPSAFWFSTDSASSVAMSDWLKDTLGETLDEESYVIPLWRLKQAPFKIYVCQQRLGDLVIVPRMSCHQVINHGGLSIKISWSILPFESLEPALHMELPVYQRVGRNEVYRVKLTIYRSIVRLTTELNRLTSTSAEPTVIAVVYKKLRHLLDLYEEILTENYDSASQEDEEVPDSSAPTPGLEANMETENTQVTTANEWEHLVCKCCEADIFLSHFWCDLCDVVVCPTCYVEGRSCLCVAMVPGPGSHWRQLLDDRNNAVEALRSCSALASNETFENWTLTDIEKSGYATIFKAAYLLWKTRSEPDRKDMARCSAAGIGLQNHDIPKTALFFCAPCHRGLCFEHYLYRKLHSTDLLIAQALGPNDRHSFHMEEAKSRRGISDLDTTEKYLASRLRLVSAAQKYTMHAASDPNLILGWYDHRKAINNGQKNRRTSSVSPKKPAAKKARTDPSETRVSPRKKRRRSMA